jgi:hypothetical protein
MLHHPALALQLQVSFEDSVTGNGAMELASCTVTMTGLSTFLSNKGTLPFEGGGITISGLSTLDIRGPICAQNNQGTAAGFLSSENSRVTFSQPATARVNGNTPVDIKTLLVSPRGVFCGTSPTPWPTGSYIIKGGVCACDADFASGAKTMCDSCPFGWSSANCACKVSCWQRAVLTYKQC